MVNVDPDQPICGGIHNSPGENGFLVTPLYTTTNEAGDLKDYIDREMILRAQAYQFENVFYLPESKEFDMKESFARLDRMVFVNANTIRPKPICLSDDALELLREWTWKCFGFPLEGLNPALDKFIEKAAKDLENRLGTKQVGN